MKSSRNASFRKAFSRLPRHIQRQAIRAYQRFERDPYHPSLHFKKVHPSEPIYSVRITRYYRALGDRDGDEITWFWIGPHDEYDKFIDQL